MAQPATVLRVGRVQALGYELAESERVMVGLRSGSLIANHTDGVAFKYGGTKAVPVAGSIAALFRRATSAFLGAIAGLAPTGAVYGTAAAATRAGTGIHLRGCSRGRNTLGQCAPLERCLLAKFRGIRVMVAATCLSGLLSVVSMQVRAVFRRN
jgi:hypothetical protein